MAVGFNSSGISADFYKPGAVVDVALPMMGLTGLPMNDETSTSVAPQAYWESLGLRMQGAWNRASLLATWRLPEGWRVRLDGVICPDYRRFTLVRPDHSPCATVFIRTAVNHQSGQVDIYTGAEAARTQTQLAAKAGLDPQYQKLLADYFDEWRSYQGTQPLPKSLRQRATPAALSMTPEGRLDTHWQQIQAFKQAHPEFTEDGPSELALSSADPSAALMQMVLADAASTQGPDAAARLFGELMTGGKKDDGDSAPPSAPARASPAVGPSPAADSDDAAFMRMMARGLNLSMRRGA